MEKSWGEKYKPRNMKDLIMNKEMCRKIASWLRKYDEHEPCKKAKSNMTIHDYANIIISGSHGSGKTVSCEITIREVGMEPIFIDINRLKKDDLIGDKGLITMRNFKCNNHVTMSVSDVKKKRNVIIIDNVDTISSTNNKAVVNSLYKINTQHRIAPLILISTNQHSKFMSDIKKSMYCIKFSDPSFTQMRDLLITIANKEKIRIDTENNTLLGNIIEHAQKDIRRLINTLYEIKQIYGGRRIGKKEIEHYAGIAQMKDMYLDLYTTTNNLMHHYKSIDDCLELFETEKVKLPLMIQENYGKVISKNCLDKKTRRRIIGDVVDVLSTADVIDNITYSDQNWDLQEIVGCFSCAIPSYVISKGCNKDTFVGMGFPADLHKTSIQKINKKNITHTNSTFSNMNIVDFIYLGKIMEDILERGDVELYSKIADYYDISLSDMQSLIKLDKMNKDQSDSTSLAKKLREFSKII